MNMETKKVKLILKIDETEIFRMVYNPTPASKYEFVCSEGELRNIFEMLNEIIKDIKKEVET